VLSLSFGFRRGKILRANLGTKLDTKLGTGLIGGVGSYLGAILADRNYTSVSY